MQIGVVLEKGPIDWQIIQQTKSGGADIGLSGSFIPVEDSVEQKVFVRIVKEDTGSAVIPWQESEDSGSHRWRILIEDVPAGGLYRIETCLVQNGDKAFEWGTRGDMVHHVGIGDVYVIAGQSNSAGYGKDPVYDPPEIGIHLLKNNGKWDLATHPMNESTNTVHEENRENANPGHSPYLSFSRQLKRELGYPIGLIQASLGGSPLGAWNPEENGVLYKNMMKIIASQGGKVKGILWYQGCSDAGEGLCDTYLTRFKRMVFHLRNDLQDGGLPILTVQLNRHTVPASEASNAGWGKVREAQRQAPKEIDNVFVIPSIDCTLSDSIHNNSASNMVLGERLAGTALKNIYGKGNYAAAPDLEEARKIESNKVLLTFNHICNRLYTFCVSAEELPFIVEDENGIAHIESYEQNEANTVIITVDRVLTGKCLVHGASEQNPGSMIPIDFASHLPMLSFYGVEILEK